MSLVNTLPTGSTVVATATYSSETTSSSPVTLYTPESNSVFALFSAQDGTPTNGVNMLVITYTNSQGNSVTNQFVPGTVYTFAATAGDAISTNCVSGDGGTYNIFATLVQLQSSAF
jgi:hypothetical protein